MDMVIQVILLFFLQLLLQKEEEVVHLELFITQELNQEVLEEEDLVMLHQLVEQEILHPLVHHKVIQEEMLQIQDQVAAEEEQEQQEFQDLQEQGEMVHQYQQYFLDQHLLHTVRQDQRQVDGLLEVEEKEQPQEQEEQEEELLELLELEQPELLIQGVVEAVVTMMLVVVQVDQVLLQLDINTNKKLWQVLQN
jgi:hypothetical protein